MDIKSLQINGIVAKTIKLQNLGLDCQLRFSKNSGKQQVMFAFCECDDDVQTKLSIINPIDSWDYAFTLDDMEKLQNDLIKKYTRYKLKNLQERYNPIEEMHFTEDIREVASDPYRDAGMSRYDFF